MIHMRPQLMGAAGHGFERNPRQRPPGGLHHRIIGNRKALRLLAMAHDAHERIVLALFLGEEGRERPCWTWERPPPAPNTPCGPNASGKSWRSCRGKAVLATRRSRRYPSRAGVRAAAAGRAIAQEFQHAVEMPRGAGAALHRKPHRLVQDQYIVVLEERDRFEKPSVFPHRLRCPVRLFGRIQPSGGMRTVCPASRRFFGSVRCR